MLTDDGTKVACSSDWDRVSLVSIGGMVAMQKGAGILVPRSLRPSTCAQKRELERDMCRAVVGCL